MASQLEAYIEKNVNVITSDGGYYSGVLKGFDQTTNLYLNGSTLTTWSPFREDIRTEDIVIRGDTVVLIALRSSDELPEESENIPSIS